MMNYNRINNIGGWLAFTISFIVFVLTMAPTASFWDCGEFIACANELEVPHPPGAPFFLILGRFFALFAGGNGEAVPYMVNMLSVLASAFTVLFIFWTTTHLAKKVVISNLERTGASKELTQEHILGIFFAGLVAALTCTFTDSFWFNAVEAEVYALSSFFTAAVVWMMFKWEAHADEPHSIRYIVLIAFLMGISIGVHLLNLLTIPALALIYYFRKYTPTLMGALTTLGIGVVMLAVVQYGVVQGLVDFAWGFEKIMVGTESLNMTTGLYEQSGMGMPMGTGIVLFMFLLIGGLFSMIYLSQKEERIGKDAGLLNNIMFYFQLPVTGLCYIVPALFTDRYKSRSYVDGLYEFYRDTRVVFNVCALSVVMVLIGYSSYTMIPIRANANTTINENDPSTITAFLSYLRREQYGDRPLFRGPRYNNYNAFDRVPGRPNFMNVKEPVPLKDGAYPLESGETIAVKGGKVTNLAALSASGETFTGKITEGPGVEIDMKTGRAFRHFDRYVFDGYKDDLEYRSGSKVFFPRMHSINHYSAKDHAYGYERYVTDKGNTPSPMDDNPSTSDDMSFFLDYQFRHMYWRYFMWQFAGRSSDIQDDGWEAIGMGADLPDTLQENKGRNHYFFLPLLLGIFGMVLHFMSRWDDAVTIALLFFFTGLAIIIYLNQTPSQPRERDYSYVGSFQTFCIWIGIGVVGLYLLLKDILKSGSAYITGGITLLLIPGIMAWQNWDDHDRHLRLVAPDSAYNLLNSCEKNAILFTNGDNDTFPLWYIQEVEGVRTDVRVVNLSLLNTDWYIDQMKTKQNDSPGLPISLSQLDYIGEKNAAQPWRPGQKIALKVDKAALIANGVVSAADTAYVESPMVWTMPTRGGANNSYILKQDWLILDMLLTNAQNGWERPIYFSSTIPSSSYIGLTNWFQTEGLAYRVVPIQRGGRAGNPENMNMERTYELLTKVFKYRGLDDPNLYVDDHIRKTIIGNLRININRAASNYIMMADAHESSMKDLELQITAASASGDSVTTDSLKKALSKLGDVNTEEYRKRAKELLELAETRISSKAVPMQPFTAYLAAQTWSQLGDKDKAGQMIDELFQDVRQHLEYSIETGSPIRGNDRKASVLRYIQQYHLENRDYQRAEQASDLLCRYSNDPEICKTANQLRQFNSQQAPPAGNPTPEGGQTP